MAYVLGIDIGSGFSKAVICKDKAILSHAIMPSGGNYKETAWKVAEIALERINLSMSDISSTIATGYGATMVDFADQSITDISCHAAGVHLLFPRVRTLIDIGAQFSKAIRLNDAGKVINFVLNEKCAGGSGKFLHVIARILHMNIEEIGELSLKSDNPVEFTTGCAVFAESEAVSRIAEGALPSDILAGVHKAMASKIVNLVVRLGLIQDCAITGGGAKDLGLVRAIEGELNTDIIVPEEPRITAAFGAALSASENIHQ
ncbi:MAG: acyl-CoA dehydratase activase [Proteobacteria bacterium]|nr:acyl-CoA dehydratase activase [Pseudomonadota bacterium]